MICGKVLKSGRAWLLTLDQRQCVLVRDDARRPQAEKLRLLDGSPEVAGFFGSIALHGESYIAVEYIGGKLNGADEKDFADLVQVLASLNQKQVPQYPLFDPNYYETSFHWCRKLIEFLRDAGAVAVPHDLLMRFDRLAGELLTYHAAARKALVHGDPTDFNCGRDAAGQVKLFDFGLSGMDMWLKDIALRLGGSTSPRPPVGDDGYWLAMYLRVHDKEIPATVWREFGLTRRICRLYYDEESLRHFRDHPIDPVYCEWAQRIVRTVTDSESTAFDPRSR